ncbi:MAG: T9SS type A sorting domain-containing protein, partial [Vicingaceae bacterium]
MKKLNYHIILLIALFLSFSLNASHTKYGQITWECLNNGKYVFHFEMVMSCTGSSYSNQSLSITGNPLPRDNNNNVIDQIQLKPDSAKWLANKNGFLFPICSSDTLNGNIDCSASSGLQKYYFISDTITLNGLPPSKGWTFSWQSTDIRGSFSNLQGNSSNPYAKSIMYAHPKQTANQCFDSSPTFIEPLHSPHQCLGDIVLNYGAIDKDMDSLVYYWGYIYTSSTNTIGYQTNYSHNNPLPDTNFNSNNQAAQLESSSGLVSASVNSGSNSAYAIGLRIDSWKGDHLIASVFKVDIVLLSNCPELVNNNKNDQPKFNLISSQSKVLRLKAKAGDKLSFPITLSDTNTTVTPTGLQNVKLFAEGSLFASDYIDTSACLSPPCATLTNQSPAFDSLESRFALEGLGAVGTNFKWEPSCNHLSDSGKSKKHYFYFLGKDDHCPVPAVNHSVVEIEVEPLLSQGVQISNDTLISLDEVNHYQWYDCNSNSIISGANADFFTPSSSGSYAMILENGSCKDTSECILFTTVGLSDPSFQSTVNFYPNPTNGLFNIELGHKQESLQIKVRNIHGQLVEEKAFVDQKRLQ